MKLKFRLKPIDSGWVHSNYNSKFLVMCMLEKSNWYEGISYFSNQEKFDRAIQRNDPWKPIEIKKL